MKKLSLVVVAAVLLLASTAGATGGALAFLQWIAGARTNQVASLNDSRSLSVRGSPVRAGQFSARTFDVDAATESLVIDEPTTASGSDPISDFATLYAMGFTLSIGSAETGSACYTLVARTSTTSCVTACATLAAGDLTCTLTGDVTSDGKALRPGQAVTEWLTGEDCLCAEASEANVDVNVAQVSRYPGG